MVFVFDLDDTICDTDKYSEEFIKSFFIENRLPYKQIAKNVRYAEQKFDWDHKTALRWYKEFGDEMFLNFPCKPNVVEIINYLHNEGHKIIIATARANDWHTEPKKMTLAWLKNNDIKYDKLYIGRVDKEKICEKEKADFFIDDDIEITKRVAEYFASKNKGKAFLMNTNYNRNLTADKRVTRVESFDEFTSLIDDENQSEL